MEILSLILAVISTIAAVISAIVAVSTRNEVKKLSNQVNGSGNLQNSGKISIKNHGDNQGIISGVNTGEINK